MMRESRIRRRGASGGGSGGGSGSTIGEWHYINDPGEPTFENSYTDLPSLAGPGYQRSAFRLIDDDYIEVVGGFIGAPNTTIFTLPVGFRPNINNTLALGVCVDISGSGDSVFQGFRVLTDGSVISGANPLGFGAVLFGSPVGNRFAIDPPELST